MLSNEYNKNDSVELSVVIPCYNSVEAIEELHERLVNTLSHITKSYEIIYVNDCSSDDTIQKINEIASVYGRVIAVDLMFNVGQFRAVMCGLDLSKGNYVITMDDDLQHPPEEIRKLYSEIKNNDYLDAVIGSFEKKKHSFFRNIGTAIVRKTMKHRLYSRDSIHKTSAFRCLNRPLVNSIIQYKAMFPSIGSLIRRSTSRIQCVVVEHHERKFGKSNYSITKLLRLYLNLVINYTALPLRIVSAAGVVLSMIGFFLALFYTFRFFLSPVSVPGWTTLVVMLNFYSGLLLLSIGIVGEYLLRILQQVSGYPRYIIRTIKCKESIN